MGWSVDRGIIASSPPLPRSRHCNSAPPRAAHIAEECARLQRCPASPKPPPHNATLRTLLMGMKMKSGSNLLIHLSTLPKRLISGSSLLVRGLGLQCDRGQDMQKLRSEGAIGIHRCIRSPSSLTSNATGMCHGNADEAHQAKYTS